MIVFAATVFLSLGLVNLNVGRDWWRGQALRLVVGVPIVLVYVYLEMPPLVFPQALTYLLLTLVPNAAYSSLLAARTAIASRRVVSIRRTPLRPYLIPAAALGIFAAILTIAPIVDAGGLRDVVSVTQVAGLPPDTGLAHVRVVPQEAAEFAGNKVVGQLGTYYRVGDFNIQAAAGQLVWVAPLEFHGLVQWLARRTSPGFVIVSAEHPDASAELRQRAPMRYVPSAFLNDNLYRHVYMTYGTELILETTLQLDQGGNPQYLCTLGRPTIGWSGVKVTGVVIVDPATGAMRRVDRSAFASLPAWVSRVYPPDLALEYNVWFGEYVHGLINALLVKRDVHVPARDEVFGLLAGPRFVWFVDHTSPASDQSMTGFTLMDSVTGAVTYYTSSGGEFNSRGAEDAVASNPIVRQGKLYPTQPILYTVFAKNTWVVPLIAETGKFQTIALVEAQNGRVVVGSNSAPSPERDAFAQYAALFNVSTGFGAGAAGAGSTQLMLTGTLARVASAPDGTLYFTLLGRRTIYALDTRDEPAALLAHAGDRVRFAPSPANPYARASAFEDAQLDRGSWGTRTPAENARPR